MSNRRYVFFQIIICIIILPSFSQIRAKPKYLDSKAPVDERVKDLMERMTIEEKVAQMSQYVGLEHMKKAEKEMSIEEMKKVILQVFIQTYIRQKLRK